MLHIYSDIPRTFSPNAAKTLIIFRFFLTKKTKLQNKTVRFENRKPKRVKTITLHCVGAYRDLCNRTITEIILKTFQLNNVLPHHS